MKPPVIPLLGDLHLETVRQVKVDQNQALVYHRVPGLAGDVIQHLDRDSTQITLQGVLSGEKARENLQKLRDKFHSAEPMPFIADIMTASEVKEVVIADLQVQELAGQPNKFNYRLKLEEYIAPPEKEEETEPVDDDAEKEAEEETGETEEQIEANQGVLEVAVEPGDPGENLDNIKLLVQGQKEDGQEFSVVLDKKDETDGVFRKTDMPAGQYTVTLLLAD